jgi:DNA-binding response OmpR family regulator
VKSKKRRRFPPFSCVFKKCLRFFSQKSREELFILVTWTEEKGEWIMDTPCVLVVDDDREIVRAIAKLLELEGYQVLKAYNGMEAMDILMSHSVQLIILDVMMPKMDGLSATMKIREVKNIPIIILSAKTEDSDKIIGLSMGADDYVTKPFNPSELMARVKSQLRRYIHLGDIGGNAGNGRNIISVGGLTIRSDSKELTVDGEPVRLTATEFKILELLMSNAGRVFSAEEIYRRVWNEDAYSVENTVMVHIRHIREKIEINPKEPKYLKVVWGIGYKVEKI